MTGRILIVDDMEPNIRVLTAKLEAEYYEVLTATSGADAILLAREQLPDMILLDVMMPVMDGFETCRQLKRDPLTQHIPVVMVTALGEQSDRVDGLQAGADDFLSKPIDDLALFARVRSLLRLNTVMDELRSREASSRASGSMPVLLARPRNAGGQILIVEANERLGQRIAVKLGDPYQCQIVSDQKQAAELADGDIDLVLINLETTAFDGLRLCARIRANEKTRQMPILGMIDIEDKERAVRALDIGANDILARPVDSSELQARVRTLLQRRFYAEQLRENLDQSVEMAFTDQLTDLFNRRHLDAKLQELGNRASLGEETSVLLISDIDHFKQVNDTYGHQAGDMVLQEIAKLLKSSFRAIDIICRYGGEEFVILMPGADLDSAKGAAERFRLLVESTEFHTGKDQAPIRITMSGGLTMIEGNEKNDAALSRADAALYHAKENGRNRMVTAKKQPKLAKTAGQG
ncbi:Pole remodelling regulatory diguanylate cyclase [hydrothermal vent metagenome]|uniref:Pole remodelling regulatory diguanylate cyclase n=1 Tax=hydrothermal vent metagenome TaxID=652676 RepID=A0A3B0SGV1_9ZZZZ